MTPEQLARAFPESSPGVSRAVRAFPESSPGVSRAVRAFPESSPGVSRAFQISFPSFPSAFPRALSGRCPGTCPGTCPERFPSFPSGRCSRAFPECSWRGCMLFPYTYSFIQGYMPSLIYGYISLYMLHSLGTQLESKRVSSRDIYYPPLFAWQSP